MPEDKVTDLITDQEIAFAQLILSGTMTDQRAAAAVSLNPSTAGYIKSKPRVQAYMREHRTRVQQQPLAQEAEGSTQQKLRREQVLARLWEIANLSPDMTRNSVTAQVKALTLIIAIEGLIPGKTTDRRAGAAENKPDAPVTTRAQIYQSAWLRKPQEQTTNPNQQEGLGIPPVEPVATALPDPIPDTAPETSPDRTDPTLPNRLTRSETQSAPRATYALDTRVPDAFGPRR